MSRYHINLNLYTSMVLFSIAATFMVVMFMAHANISEKPSYRSAEWYQKALEPEAYSPYVESSETNSIEYISDYLTSTAYKHSVYKDLAELYATYFVEAANEYDLNVNELVALGKVESNYVRTAKSSKDCIGIMQVNFNVWGEILVKEGIIEKKTDLYHPKLNIMCGAYIFNHYLNEGIESGHYAFVDYAVMRYVGTSLTYIAKRDYTNHHYLNKWYKALNEFTTYTDS